MTTHLFATLAADNSPVAHSFPKIIPHIQQNLVPGSPHFPKSPGKYLILVVFLVLFDIMSQVPAVNKFQW